MKKTIKQRFFLSLCLLMLFSLFGGGNLAWAGGTETITLANGTYNRGTGTIVWAGNYCTITQAKGKSSKTVNSSYIAKPRWYASHVITFAAEEGYTLTGVTIVATSNDYANALSGSTYSTGASALGSGTTVTITTSGDFTVTMSAQSRISSIKVSYVANNETVLETNPDGPLSFGDVETSSSKQLSFTLSGRNLTADATLSITGTNAGYFSVDPASVSPTDGTIEGKDVTVTYAPTAKGEHNATLQIKSGETIKEITLSGTGIAPLPTYNVSWMVNGVQTTEQVKEGTEIPFTDPDAASIPTGYSFVGWTDTQVEGKLTYAPTLVSSPVTASKDATYYAVFAVSKSTGNEVWEEITTVPKPGTYAILSDSYFMKAKITSKRFENGEATPEISDATPATLTTAPASDCIWEITNPDGYYRIAYGSQYAGGTSSASKNQGALLDDASVDLAKWTIKLDGSKFSISNYGRSNLTDNTRQYLRNNGEYGWACYASDATAEEPRLFKKTTETVLSDYCTTIPDVQLSVGETGYATLYYSNYDLVVPENTEAYTFRSSNGALVESKTYAEGTVIPAGEAVVVYTANAVPCTLNFRKFIANVACDASSQLAGTDEATDITPDNAYYFYGLSLNSSNDINSVGFYWMEADGAAFTNGEHKAYLKIPTSEFEGAQPVRGFAFKGTATGVESVESSNNAPQAIYDLTGRRVSKAEKGIYIINGKKVIK